jgi:tetratricopeptide (TPR) repeat protein
VPQSQQLTIKQVLSRAKKATKQGDTALALHLYNAVLKTQPNHPFAKKSLRKLQKGLPRNQSVQAQTTNPAQDQINTLVNLYNAGRMEITEQACRELLQTYPKSLTVINILGGALNSQGKLQEAVDACNRAIEVKPDNAEAYNNRGNALRSLGQLKAAVQSCDKAIELKPDFAEAYNNRGNILKDLGQLTGAAESYKKAIEFKPDFAIAHHNLSALKEYKPDDAQIELMEGLFTGLEPGISDRMYLCFALAKVYEDLDEYDRSFKYLAEGNHLRHRELNYNIDNDREMIAGIKEIITTGSLTLDVVPDGNASIQPLFIVGMPRSGTTLVEQILASHTKVHGAGELEALNRLVAPIMNLENSEDKSQLFQNAINTMHDGYLEALAALDVPEKIITDKNPLNFRWIGFILSAFPDAKIINLNRDSRATCWSIYKHCFSKEGNGYAYDMDNLVGFYKLYIDLMSFWHERYPNSIYDLCYEDLTENQEQETRRLLEFCNLEWEKQCLDFHKSERAIKTASAAQVRKKMYKGSSEVWRKYETHLQPLIKGLGY